MPPEPEKIVSKDRKEKVDLIGHKACIPGLSPIEVEAKDAEYLLHFPPYSSELSIPLFLGGAYLAVSSSLSQNSVIDAFFPAPLFEGLRVVGLVRKDGLFGTGEKLINHLGVVDIGRGADELGHEFIFRVHGDVVLVTVDDPISFFGDGGIGIVFLGVTSGRNQAGIDDLSGLKLEALFGQLAFEFFEALAVKAHGLEVVTEAGDGGVIGDGVRKGETEEAAVEEVAVEHNFDFGIGVFVDLLDDEDFEHEEGVIGRATHGRRVEFGQDEFEGFPVDDAIKVS